MKLKKLIDELFQLDLNYKELLSEEAYEALMYYAPKKEMTEEGKRICDVVKKDEILTAEEIAARLKLPTRTISGSLKKLVSDGYLEKIQARPMLYKRIEK
jgi:DNA-binding MarR family transcriptional regulator